MKKFFKFFKIFILNLLILIFAVLLLNLFFLIADKKINAKHPFLIYQPYETHLYYLFKDNLYIRKPEGLSYTKKPIILYGGSFSYGYLLQNEQTFGYKLSHSAKRPVYNFSMASRGIQHMLYFLEKQNHYQLFEEPEYVIYTFIDDHVRRLYQPCNTYDYVEHIEYTNQNGTLKLNSSPLKYLHSLYIYNKLEKFFYSEVIKNEFSNENFDIIKKYFETSKKLFEEQYPKTKFVILLYPTENNEKYINSNRWNELKKEGFLIYNLNDLTKTDLTNKKYKTSDNVHPSEQAWNVITPVIIQKLNL